MKARLIVVSALLVGTSLLVLIMLGMLRPATAYSQPLALAVPSYPSALRTSTESAAQPVEGRGVAPPLGVGINTSGSCVHSLPAGMCVYYGDLHSHTGYSDGQGTPQQAYQMAHANGLDFFAVTDHGRFLTDAEWDDTLVQAQAATVEGQFVGLRGFEWTSEDGHVNVFDTDHFVGARDPDYDALDEFYAWLSAPAQINSVAQFDHPYYPPDPFDGLRYEQLIDRHINLVEIREGDALRARHYEAALSAGWHVAPTNNSDTHEANWGGRRGRNGILAPGLTYHHVINALRARRVFATQDEDLALAMRADGYWMGAVLPDGPFYFNVYARDPEPDDPIASLELYRDGVLFRSTIVNTNTFTWSFTLPTLSPAGTRWYVKAIQDDGDKAYSSPVWTRQPEPYDVLVRDHMWDVGQVPSIDPSWQSPDIWVRRQADGQIWHQNPVAGEINHVYARVQNIGSNPLSDVYVSFYWAHPALGLVWPDSWHPINTSLLRIPTLDPGEATTVGIPWDVPTAIPAHVCLLARLFSAQDPIRYESQAKWHNNIAGKNVHLLDISSSRPSSDTQDLTFYLANPFDAEIAADLLFASDDFPPQGSLVLYLETGLFDRWMAGNTGGLVRGAVVDPISRTVTISFPVDAVVYGLPLWAGESSTTTLALSAPVTSALALRLSEHVSGEEIGGNLYTTARASTPRQVNLEAAAGSVEISRSLQLTATVVGEGFVPVPDGTEVRFSTTLGTLVSDTVRTQNGLATVTLNAEASPGIAIVQAGVNGLVTGTTAVNVYRACWARLNDDPPDYPSVQAAVDASAHPSDVVKVAGYCSTIDAGDGLTQVVYISKTLTIRGGYTAANWSTSNPAYPTTLDAQGQGRVLYISGDVSPTIEGLSITGGDAGGLGGGPGGEDAGGGVYVISATATLRGNRVFSNSAAVGSGLYLSSADATLINNVMVANRTSDDSSGLYVGGGAARLLHNTIARNGNGVYVTNSGSGCSTLALTNTILVSHAVGITVTAGNTVTLEATLWGTATWANVADWGGAGVVNSGTISIWGDPDFSAGDYDIGPDSAALNAGVEAGVDDDIAGDPRPMGRGYDIGADELRIGLVVVKRAGTDPAQAGAPLTYTIHVTNSGQVDLHAIVTDALPSQVTPGGTLTWTPLITAPGGVWTQQVTVNVEADYSGPLTNVVRVAADEGATGVYTATSAAVVEHARYLPLVMRDFLLCAPRLVRQVSTGPQPYEVALDTAGHRAFVAHASGVTVIDTASFAVITATRAFTAAHGIAYDYDRDHIWVTSKGSNRVLVLDGATYAPLADLPAGNGPHSAAYNPANGRVYVTNYWDWTVSVYDAATLTYTASLTDVAEPAHLAVNPVTNKIYVANHWPGNHVTMIDGVTHSSQRVQTGLVDAYGVTVDSTRNLVYVTAIAHARIAVINGATDTQLGYLEIQRGDGTRVPLRVVAVNPGVGPEGHLWVVTSSEDGGRDQLLLIPGSWPALGTPVPLDVAGYPLEGIALDVDRNRVWVTSVQSGLVNVVQDGEPLCTIPFAARLSPRTIIVDRATE